MLNYAVYLTLIQALGEISKLTVKLKANSGSFAVSVAEYFMILQKIADDQRLYIASDVAIALQKLCTYDGKATETVKRRNPRKERDEYAVKCLSELHSKIKEYLEKYNKTYEECADVCRQIVAQIMTHNPNVLRISNDVVSDVMTIASKEEALKPYYAHVVGAIGIFNARAVFDTVMPQMGI